MGGTAQAPTTVQGGRARAVVRVLLRVGVVAGAATAAYVAFGLLDNGAAQADPGPAGHHSSTLVDNVSGVPGGAGGGLGTVISTVTDVLSTPDHSSGRDHDSTGQHATGQHGAGGDQSRAPAGEPAGRSGSRPGGAASSPERKSGGPASSGAGAAAGSRARTGTAAKSPATPTGKAPTGKARTGKAPTGKPAPAGGPAELIRTGAAAAAGLAGITGDTLGVPPVHRLLIPGPAGGIAPVLRDPVGAVAPVLRDPVGAVAPVLRDPVGAVAPILRDPVGAVAGPLGLPDLLARLPDSLVRLPGALVQVPVRLLPDPGLVLDPARTLPIIAPVARLPGLIPDLIPDLIPGLILPAGSGIDAQPSVAPVDSRDPPSAATSVRPAAAAGAASRPVGDSAARGLRYLTSVRPGSGPVGGRFGSPAAPVRGPLTPESVAGGHLRGEAGGSTAGPALAGRSGWQPELAPGRCAISVDTRRAGRSADPASPSG